MSLAAKLVVVVAFLLVSFLEMHHKFILKNNKMGIYMRRSVYSREFHLNVIALFWLARWKILACPMMKELLLCTTLCVLGTRKLWSSWCSLGWTWTLQTVMDGKGFTKWLLMDVLHKSQDLGAAAGPSEYPLLFSCGAGDEFCFQSRATAVLCGASYGTVRMGKQGN